MARLTARFLDTPVLLGALGEVAGPPQGEILTGVLNVYEAVHRLLQQRQRPAANAFYERALSVAHGLTRRRIFEASALRVRHMDRGLSYADAAGYVTARELGARFLTSDRGFAGLAGVELVSL